MEKWLLIFKTIWLSFSIAYVLPLLGDYLKVDYGKTELSGSQLVRHPIFGWYIMISFVAMVITGILIGRLRIKNKKKNFEVAIKTLVILCNRRCMNKSGREFFRTLFTRDLEGQVGNEEEVFSQHSQTRAQSDEPIVTQGDNYLLHH